MLENEIVTLIELNPANLDLTWNLVIHIFFIFETKAIEHIRAILHVELGYFSIIYPILSNFYGFDVLVVLTGMNNNKHKSYGFKATP